MRRLSLLAILMLLISGCAPAPSSENGELRIIAAAAGAAEILNEIGLADSIVGVDERNAKASKAQVVTSGHSFNFEQVISLRPSYVIIDSLTDSSQVRQQFRESKIEIIELPTAENINQIFDKYQILGKQFRKVAEAESASNALKARFDEFKASNRSFRIAFLYLRGTNAIYFVGGKGSGADSLIEAVGSIDVGAAELSNPFSPLTAEVMRKLNPEVLLLMNNGFESVGGLAGLKSLPGLSGTLAVKNGNIVLIDDRELLDFGPETIDVLRQIQDQLRALDAA